MTMRALKPKEWHEQHLASIDKEKIVEYLNNGQEQDITRIAVTLSRQCDLLDHFRRLWKMRVVDLDPRLSSDGYTEHIYVSRRALHKELFKKDVK
jgi:hypothetical protein